MEYVNQTHSGKASLFKLLLCALFIGVFTFNADAQSYAIVNGNHVNVRNQPSTNAAVLFQLNKGTRVIINYNWNTVTGWTPIIYNGNYGYINNQFLNFKTGSSTPARPSYQMATVTGDRVRVRTSPSFNASVKKYVNRGKKVALDRNRPWTNGFIAVIVDGKTYGYIHADYLYW